MMTFRRILASLNLPAALDDVTNQEALPESIRQKSSKIKSLGGIDALTSLIADLPNIQKRNQEILDEVCCNSMFELQFR